MRGDCSIRIGGIGFTPEQIAATAAAKGLLSIELDLSNSNECHCHACSKIPGTVLSFEELGGLIDQAKALGAKRCILVDSAGQSHPWLGDLIVAIRLQNMEVELFTAGMGLDAKMAALLHQNNVAVVVEASLPPSQLHAPASCSLSPVLRGEGWGEGCLLDPEMPPHPNPLPGVPGRGDRSAPHVITAADRRHHSSLLETLLAAGYSTAGAPRLAARISIAKQTLDAVPDWWRKMRLAGIEPYVQIMTRSASDDLPQDVARRQIRKLFETLHQIDRDEFAKAWDKPPELTGRSCKRHLFAVHVTPCGTIFACVGVTIPLGNIRTQSLRTILDESEVLENIRAFEQKVKEPCRTCCKTADCYGCRGSAYQLTGDYLAGDQLCWKAGGTPIPTLPTPIGTMIPHGPSIRLVDQILAVGERTAQTEFIVRADSLFVDKNGLLDETAYIEMIAQSFAASHGFHLSADEQAMHRGMLLGVKDMIVHGNARAGDRLLIDVRKVARFGDFGVVEGTVSREDGTILASAEIKVWRPSGEAEKAMLA